MKRIWNWIKKFGFYLLFITLMIISVLTKRKKSVSQIKEKKEDVKKQVEMVKKTEIELKQKTKKLETTISTVEEKVTKIKKDKEERDEVAKKFFPDL